MVERFRSFGKTARTREKVGKVTSVTLVKGCVILESFGIKGHVICCLGQQVLFKEGIAMLVLSRKPSQTIHIGDNIKVTIVQIKGNQVKVAIEAPDDVRILRGELCEWWSADEAAEPPVRTMRPVQSLSAR